MSEVRRYHVVNGELTRAGRDTINPPPPPPAIERFPGDPNAPQTGTLFYGQSRTLNGDISFRETAIGVSIPEHRSYFRDLSSIAVPNGGLLVRVRDDHANDRLPIVSTKLDWAGVAAGTYNAQIDAMIVELNSYLKPTYFCMHHEPENDAQLPADWRAAQVVIRNRIERWKSLNPTKPNRVAFVSILMAYTWSSFSGRNPETWWAGSGVHDAVLADHYTEPSAGILRAQFTDFVAWTQAKGVPFGVGEYGVNPLDTNGPAKMQQLYDYCLARDCVAISYFDSSEGNAGHTWVLDNTNGALNKHIALIKAASTCHLSDLGY